MTFKKHRNIGEAITNASVAVNIDRGDDDLVGLAKKGNASVSARRASLESFQATRTVLAITCLALLAATKTGRPMPSTKLPTFTARNGFSPLSLPVMIRSAVQAETLRARVGLRTFCSHLLAIEPQAGNPITRPRPIFAPLGAKPRPGFLTIAIQSR
jgi:hypothetical protein